MPLYELGQRFGKYRLVRYLGRGAMGIVYLAEDETLGRQIALKVLDRTIITNPEFEARFRQEAKTIARLQHPNIVQIHALEAFNGDLAIDMAYIEGGPLSEVVATSAQAIKWTTDVLTALCRCHDSGIIHRDVKPSNILLSLEGAALLSDFGLAKLLAVQQSENLRCTTSSCMFVGTPRYAPPEAWDAAEPSPAWDVYSVGMVLYEKLSPRYPYDAETPLALLKQILERPIPTLSQVAANVSPQLSEAVAAMLSASPGQRPADAATALEMLRGVPESDAATSANGTTLALRKVTGVAIMHRAPVRLNWRRRLDRVALHRRLGVLVLFLAVLAGFLVWQVASFSARHDGKGADSAPLNLSVAQVFDTVDPSGPSVWPAHWLMEPSATPDEWRILASADSHLWSLSARKTDRDQFAFTGNWAEYTSPTARLFRYGDCAGSGRLVPNRDELAINLEFKDKMDAGKRTKSFLIRPSAAAPTPEVFIVGLQKADYVSALLYNEIQPRNLPWLDPLEKNWLRRVTKIVTVPHVNVESSKIEIDGRLDEPVWQASLAKDIQSMGQLTSDGPVKATLFLRYSSEALYLGIRASELTENCLVEVGLLRTYDLHTADSPRWVARFKGNAVVSALYTNQQRQAPWTCDWQGAATNTGPEWQAELRLPLASLASAAIPIEGQRWRLSCALRRDDHSATPSTLSRWGNAESLDVEQGIVMVFGSEEFSR